MARMKRQEVDFTVAGYGLLTSDPEVYDALLHSLIDYCEAHDLYRRAASYTRMLNDMGEEALAQVFDEAIADSMSRENYEEAISWAEQHPDSSRLYAVKDEVFSCYFSADDLEGALEFAVRYGTDEDGYLQRVYEAADQRFRAQHITDFYFLVMDEAARRACNATPLAISKQVAYLDANGRVQGLKDVSWSDAVSLSMNEFHTLCLFSNGRVEASGSTGYGRCSVSSWTDIVDIAAGERHSVGLKASGSVVAVGDNVEGQCNVSGWRAVIAVAAGKLHTVGLRADGTVLMAGQPTSGSAGSVAEWTNVVDVAAGSVCVAGLRADGTLYLSGDGTPALY